jgi:uncharacterized protein (TIGR00369 family)
MNPKEQVPDSGLEERLRQRLQTVPVALLLGTQFVSCARHEAVLRLPHRPELTNDLGIVHGGILASLADSAIAFALATHFGGRMGFATADLTIQYLRRATTDVLAKARITRIGSTVAHGDADLVSPDGELLARGVATFILTTVRGNRDRDD